MAWPEFDRAMAIALGRVERNTGRYGEWLPDATDPANDPQNATGPDSPPIMRWPAIGPFTNWAEKSVLDMQDAHRKAAGENANLNGLFWALDAPR